jgi:hypothetical protein
MTVHLACHDAEAARAVADEWRPFGGPGNTAATDGADVVVIRFTDERFPLDIAEWAYENGKADNDDAARVIRRAGEAQHG